METFLILLLIVFIFSFLFYRQEESYEKKISSILKDIEKQKPDLIKEFTSNYNKTKDLSLSRIYDPLMEPEKSGPTPIFNSGLPVNMSSRIYNPMQLMNPQYITYQQVGFLKNMENDALLPLFGSTKYPDRSDLWNYYTIADNNIKIPIINRNNNEFLGGEKIKVEPLKGTYLVSIYQYDSPRYIANIV